MAKYEASIRGRNTKMSSTNKPEDVTQYLAYDQIDVMVLALVAFKTLRQMPKEKAKEIIQRIYHPNETPSVSEKELASYIEDRINFFAYITKEPEAQETVEGLNKYKDLEAGEQALKEILNGNPMDVAKRMIKYPKTTELLNQLYEEIVEEE